MSSLSESAPRWIWLVCSTVILAAVAVIIVVLFMMPQPTLFQYRLAIAFLCFALSATAGLLFAANVEIKGSVGKLTLTLAGPAALWVATMIIFETLFPEKSLPRGKEYDLRLSLVFPEANQANPFRATVNAFVKRQGQEGERLYTANLVKGVGGIVVHLDRIVEGDKLHVLVEDEGQRWRSNDMIAPNTHLQMNQISGDVR